MPHVVRSDLVQALDATLAELSGDRVIDRVFSEGAISFAFSSNNLQRCVTDVLNKLKADPLLTIFDGQIQVMPWSGLGVMSRVDYRQLAEWLVRRAFEVGANDAVADLERYVDASELPFLLTAAIKGIEPDAHYDLGGGVTLVPWNGLPECKTKRNYEKNGEVAPAALTCTHTSPKLHVASLEGPPIPPVDYAPLQDAVLCLALVGPSAVQTQALWVAEPAWVPRFVTTSQPSPCSGRVDGSKKFSTVEATEAARLVRLFIALPKKDKDALRLSMARLNQAMLRISSVDAAIDLGIVLESLFLSGMPSERAEMTFRLRIIGSRYLADNLADRRRLYDLLADLYALRSTAVHTGALDETFSRSGTGKKRRRVKQLLTDGYALAADAIKRLLASPQPDWLDVALG